VNAGQPVSTEAKDDGGGGDNWTTGAASRAKLQSNHHHQQTNIQLFLQARCPSCCPTNNVKALKGKISQYMDLLTPSSPGGIPVLSLTSNSSWLPWGRVAMPLICPWMPVPQGSPVMIQRKLPIQCFQPTSPMSQFQDEKVAKLMQMSDVKQVY